MVNHDREIRHGRSQIKHLAKLRVIGPDIQCEAIPGKHLRPLEKCIAAQQPIRRRVRIRAHGRMGMVGSGVADAAHLAITGFH